ISHLTDRGHTVGVNQPDLSGGEADMSPVLGFSQQLRTLTGTSNKLSTVSRSQLDGVNDRASRDIDERQSISRQNFRPRPAGNACPHLELAGSQNVALLAVLILKQRDARRPIRVVLN